MVGGRSGNLGMWVVFLVFFSIIIVFKRECGLHNWSRLNEKARAERRRFLSFCLVRVRVRIRNYSYPSPYMQRDPTTIIIITTY